MYFIMSMFSKRMNSTDISYPSFHPTPSMLYILTYIFTFVSDISNRIKFHSTATVIPYFTSRTYPVLNDGTRSTIIPE